MISFCKTRNWLKNKWFFTLRTIYAKRGGTPSNRTWTNFEAICDEQSRIKETSENELHPRTWSNQTCKTFETTGNQTSHSNRTAQRFETARNQKSGGKQTAKTLKTTCNQNSLSNQTHQSFETTCTKTSCSNQTYNNFETTCNTNAPSNHTRTDSAAACNEQSWIKENSENVLHPKTRSNETYNKFETVQDITHLCKLPPIELQNACGVNTSHCSMNAANTPMVPKGA